MIRHLKKMKVAENWLAKGGEWINPMRKIYDQNTGKARPMINMAATWPVTMCVCALDSMGYMQHRWSETFAQCEDMLSNECLWFFISASYPLSYACSVNTAGAASRCASVCLIKCFYFWGNPGYTLREAKIGWSWFLSAADKPDTSHRTPCTRHTHSAKLKGSAGMRQTRLSTIASWPTY